MKTLLVAAAAAAAAAELFGVNISLLWPWNYHDASWQKLNSDGKSDDGITKTPSFYPNSSSHVAYGLEINPI